MYLDANLAYESVAGTVQRLKSNTHQYTRMRFRKLPDALRLAAPFLAASIISPLFGCWVLP